MFERRGEARVFARGSTLKGQSWFGEEKPIQRKREVKKENKEPEDKEEEEKKEDNLR